MPQSGEVDRRGRRIRRWIIGAFAALGLIGAGTHLAIYFEFARKMPEAASTAYRRERAAHAIDEVGDDLAEVWRLLELRLKKPENGGALAEVEITLERLDTRVMGLHEQLDPSDMAALRPVFPLVADFHDAALQTITAIRRGDHAEGQRVFEKDTEPLARALRPRLEKISDQTRLQAGSSLADLHVDLVRMETGHPFVMLAFGVLLAAAAVLTLREMQRQQAALSMHVERLEDANRDLDAFAGRVAHDIRSPLSPLPMVAQLLQTNAHDPEKVRSLAVRIQRSVEKTDALIRSLLAFSRSGQVSGIDERCRVDEVARSVLRQVEDDANAARIELSIDAKPVEAAMAEPLLEQILDNLVRNAIRYMGASERRLVRVTAREGRGHVRVAVIDTGPGVPAEARGRLFEPFQRLHFRADGGIGLGLATVRRIVEAYGGRVEVEDNPGGGAVFWFTLPLAAEEIASEDADNAEPPPLH